jgi:DNA repair photolyase
MKVKETQCKSAIGKCGFPGGGLAINPYVGCIHNCAYCYARFIKRFTGHTEDWGTFADARINIAEVLEKQLKSSKYKDEKIFIGTVTDPYQPIEKQYRLTRKILQVLTNYKNPISILTKSDLVFRDVDLLKKIKNLDINFTVNTLDEKWKKIIEPNSSTIKERLDIIEKLTKEGINVLAMVGPYWPFFTDPEALFKEFKRVGIKHVFSESFNTIGGNWIGVEKVLRNNYPKLLPKMQEILFNKDNFYNFYNKAQDKMKRFSKEYGIPVTIYFGLGHAAKFK